MGLSKKKFCEEGFLFWDFFYFEKLFRAKDTVAGVTKTWKDISFVI